ncbi:MAG: type II toxin-antitoxin system PemK/MazF family toxin [Sulfuricella sp.]|nr:type II toxin-antitoxin system PemK/MazF family toxin [Gammaproteobacteria bacterium]
MPIMTGFEFGDVVLVPFPFTDQSAAKKRPAVVISSDAYHQGRPDLIIMAITSQVKPAQTVGEAIVQDWQGAGLLKPSAIKPVITTIERGLIINKLGQLKEDDRAALRRAIGQILG